MKHAFVTLAATAALVLGSAGTAAWAEEGPHEGHGHPSFSCDDITAHTAGKLVYLQTKLGITTEQYAAWQKYTAVVDDNTKVMKSHCDEMMAKHTAKDKDKDKDKADQPRPALNEIIDHVTKGSAEHADMLQKTGAALLDVYNVLTPDQKKTADELAPELLGHGPHGHGHHHDAD